MAIRVEGITIRDSSLGINPNKGGNPLSDKITGKIKKSRFVSKGKFLFLFM